MIASSLFSLYPTGSSDFHWSNIFCSDALKSGSSPLLRAVNKKNNGPVSLVHFDAHLDTWDTYFGAPYTHGTPFRRAREENLFLDDASMHVGIRGPLYSRDDLKNDASFGFKIIHCDEFQTEGIDKIVKRIRDRVGNNPLY